MWFPQQYKTKTKVSWMQLMRRVQWNMVWTFVFQYVFYWVLKDITYDPQHFVYRVILCAIITEALFFVAHKLFHIRLLYPYHKIHHDFVEPCAVSAMYCHPLEAVFCNQLAIIVGPMITGMTFEQKMLWAIIVAVNTLKAHSGLRFPGFNSRYHDIHHKVNYSNYGFLYLPDIFYGSCALPDYKETKRA
jgi:sterol desaturase/sphingolipid hydroxylase (fatty acid hydroxylase superfamily)